MNDMVLSVSPEELLSASGQLSGYIQTLQESFNDMKQTMSSTVGYWVGEAGDAHRQLYEEQVANTAEIIDRYREHVVDLNSMAGVYSDAEQSASNVAEQLPAIDL